MLYDGYAQDTVAQAKSKTFPAYLLMPQGLYSNNHLQPEEVGAYMHRQRRHPSSGVKALWITSDQVTRLSRRPTWLYVVSARW